MTPERWQQITVIFEAALERRPSERAAYLADECAGDPALRSEVESLLSSHQQAGSFIEKPVVAVGDETRKKAVADLELTGQSLGHYQILEKLGEGGMGVVYKARDTRLGRLVGIKVLSAESVSDAERKRRFVQEAKAASALNHGNIVTIHDIGQEQGINFIAMEYVKGKTLDEVISRRGMRVGDLLKKAVQIADALTAAHRAGIMHRDLKPGNIMVGESGVVKVLDFGLAKLMERPNREQWESTQTAEGASGTEEGLILGTVSYMSPEQAEGRKLDERSDIFSFGSVLYEMATGQKAFQGDSKLSTLSAILSKEPKAVCEIASQIPRDLEKIINRCLRKEPERRFQHMGDVRVQLEELRGELASDSTRATEVTGQSVRRKQVLAFAVILIAAIAIGTTIWHWSGRAKTVQPESAFIPVPLTTYPGWEFTPSFSPDGNEVAFAWSKTWFEQEADIYVKQIGVEEPYRLTDHPGLDVNPAWSPDGKSIAFARYLSKERVAYIVKPQRGGPERTLADFFLSGSESDDLRSKCAWTPDSQRLVVVGQSVMEEPAALFVLSLETGERQKLTNPPIMSVDTDPAISIDGRTLLFSRGPQSAPRSNLYRLKLSQDLVPQGQPEKLAFTNPWNVSPAWTNDEKEIVFVSGNLYGRLNLWKTALEPLQPQRLAFAGERAGGVTFSRHAHRLAYSVAREGSHIWKIDVSGGKPKPALKLISSTTDEMEPAYSPDGRKIAFMSKRSGSTEIWVCDDDGSHPVQLTFFNGATTNRPRWSPDGQLITFYSDARGNRDVYVTRWDGGAPRQLTTQPSNDMNPNWSADGKWIYFGSDRNGPHERWKVSVAGGTPVRVPQACGVWESPDGRYLYCEKGWPDEYSLWRVPVDGGKETLVVESLHPYAGYVTFNDGIYFISKPDEKHVSYICFKDFSMGSTRKIVPIEGVVNWGLSVSPDRSSFLYSQVDEAGSDLMLVENFR